VVGQFQAPYPWVLPVSLRHEQVFDSALNITTRTGRLTLLGQDHLCARSDQQEEGCENIERVQQHSQCSGGVQQQLEQGQEGGCESVRQEQQHSQRSGSGQQQLEQGQEGVCESVRQEQQHSQRSGGGQQHLEQGKEGGCESVRQEQQHSQSSGHEQLQYHLEREPQGLIGVSKYV